MAERFSDVFDFHNVLFIGNTEQRKEAVKWLNDEGYECFIITPSPDKFSEIIDSERIVCPERADSFFEDLYDIAKDRFFRLETHNYNVVKKIIDSTPNTEKTVVLMDDFETLFPLNDKTDNRLISLLQRGYAAKICFIMCENAIPQTPFAVRMLPNFAVYYGTTYEEVYANHKIAKESELISAIIIALKRGYVNITLLERELDVGYPKACSCIDKMEEYGIIEKRGSEWSVLVSDEEEAYKLIKEKNLLIIKKTLAKFNVCVSPVGYYDDDGRTIYKFKLEKPVKAKKISSYADDLAILLNTKKKININVGSNKFAEKFEVEIH